MRAHNATVIWDKINRLIFIRDKVEELGIEVETLMLIGDHFSIQKFLVIIADRGLTWQGGFLNGVGFAQDEAIGVGFPRHDIVRYGQILIIILTDNYYK